MNDTPTIHLVHGFIGSGKTSFARELEERIEGMRFSLDEWLINFYGTAAPAEMYLEFHQKTASLIERQWVRALELGLDVVLDFGFWTRRERDEIREKAVELGAVVKLYCVTCDEAVALERCRNRNENPDPSVMVVDEATYHQLKERFEPLGSDEPHTVVS